MKLVPKADVHRPARLPAVALLLATVWMPLAAFADASPTLEMPAPSRHLDPQNAPPVAEQPLPLPPTRPDAPTLEIEPFRPFEDGGAGAEGNALQAYAAARGDDLWAPRPWSWHLLPDNLIYTSYLAGPKEPRLATVWYDDTAQDPLAPAMRNGWLWDMTVGARVSLLRYGSNTVLHPQGFEVQVEGAGFVRLDPQDEVDLRSSDYRFGIPLVYGVGRWQTKLAYYHLSAHMGDEAMLKHPDFTRVNYLRDAMVWGNSYYLFDWMRVYGEVGYAFNRSGGAEPWEFQYGTELIQARPTGMRGAPFLAVNGMSRQELAWGGNVCVQVGWAWRSRLSERLLRTGFEYLQGCDPQYEFVLYNQNRCGIGLWYDF